MFATEEAANVDGATELVDIHQRFVTWFLWGFIQMLLPLAVGLLGAIATAINPSFGQATSGLLGCVSGCGALAWWITGIVWRFRSDGAFAVGDIPQGDIKQEEWVQTVTAEGSLF